MNPKNYVSKESLDKKELLKKELLKEVKCTTNPRPMGVGKLGSPEVIFARKFRWTLESNNLDAHFISKVDFDFVAKTIDFECMECVEEFNEKEINIHNWLESNLSKEQLVFTTYDGCGNELYRYTFSNLKVLKDKSDFDYSSSDVSTRKVSISYGKQIREYVFGKTNQKGNDNEQKVCDQPKNKTARKGLFKNI